MQPQISVTTKRDETQTEKDWRAMDPTQSPNAIQPATALLYGATAFVTNDKIFGQMKGVEIRNRLG